MGSRSILLAAILISPFIQARMAIGQGGKSLTPLTRHYTEGEVLAYHMTAINQGRRGTLHYEADAKGAARKNSSGVFIEEYTWSGLIFNGQSVPLQPGNAASRQQLSLDPATTISLPDFRKVNPMLIGPMADFMTFYADLWLAEKQGTLIRAGDHAYVKNGKPNSWADGKETVLGQDAIDFDLTLLEVGDRTATLIVRHVPPAEPRIPLPAKWMATPVADTANNWVELSKSQDGKYLAEIGKETFDVQMTIDRRDGKILSATMDNPVVALSRTCADAELTNCGEPERYTIRRQIEVKLQP
jgi:hypothetical protein